MIEFFKENKYLVTLWILCLLGLLIFLGHYSGILIDFGREIYYPQEILSGKILYKDLFNIYGPLAYQINALLYKVLGMKLSTLYGAGVCCSILTVSGIYLVAENFLSKFLSFSIGVFTIAIGVATTSLFNFNFPYSWAVLYGLVSFLFSLLFLLKFCEGKKNQNLYISALLAGIAITCKYDFLLYAFVVLAIIVKSKNWKAFVAFAIAPVLSFGALFLQGLRVESLINSISTTSSMAKSKTLTYFYQNSGIYFHPKVFVTDFLLFIKLAIPFVTILSSGYLFSKRRVLAIFLGIIGWILFFLMFDTKYSFGFLPILLLILFLISLFKIFILKEKADFKQVLLLISTIAVCAKVFWVLLLGSYGNYYVSIALVGIFACIFKYIPQKLEKMGGIFILMASLLIFLENINTLNTDNYKISTPKGTIYTSKDYAESSNQLIDFISQKTAQNDKIVIFPEGMTINFLTQRYSDDYYNSLLPLYAETFGDKKFINHYEENKPEYIIFNNLDMKDYYLRYICQDYALEFCAFVQNNYELETVIGDEFRYLIFRRK